MIPRPTTVIRITELSLSLSKLTHNDDNLWFAILSASELWDGRSKSQVINISFSESCLFSSKTRSQRHFTSKSLQWGNREINVRMARHQFLDALASPGDCVNSEFWLRRPEDLAQLLFLQMKKRSKRHTHTLGACRTSTSETAREPGWSTEGLGGSRKARMLSHSLSLMQGSGTHNRAGVQVQTLDQTSSSTPPWNVLEKHILALHPSPIRSTESQILEVKHKILF